MSALARYFHHLGKFVGGYDRTETNLTKQLIREGMDIHYVDLIEKIGKEFKDPKHTLVVFTPAIPTEVDIQWFITNGFVVEKRRLFWD